MDENSDNLKAEDLEVGRSSDPFSGDDTKIKIARALGIENFGDMKKYQHQLERLVEWGREKGAKDSEDLIWNIRQLANRVGKSPLGQNIAQHLSTYAYLELERMKIDKQMKSIEDGR